jgi:hypothetical protein
MDFKFVPLEERIAPSRAWFHRLMAEMRHLLATAQSNAANLLQEHGVQVTNDGHGNQTVVVSDSNQQQVVTVDSSHSSSTVVTRGNGVVNVQVVNDGHGQQSVVVTGGGTVVQTSTTGGQQVLVNTTGSPQVVVNTTGSGALTWSFQI